MKRLSWTNPCCEQCWIAREGNWTRVDDLEVLESVRAPSKSLDAGIEQCAFCGNPTFLGIYVRADPASVAFPRFEDDDEDAGISGR